jgi:serine/threonine protein kinase/WD40 repeat protein
VHHTPDCPTADQWQRLARGQVADAEAEALEQHLLGCATCLQIVQGMPVGDPLAEALAQLDRARLPENGESAAAGVATEGPAVPGEMALRRLRDYRIVREVGRGGMGVVYEAEQLSLGRRVALKVLPAQAVVNPTYLERFRQEAKAAAKLHHTNIVPVFGVGEDDGVHFYAMQFIAGEGLDKVLHGLRRLRHQPGTPAEATPTLGTVGPASIASSLLSGRFTATTMPPAPGADPAPPPQAEPSSPSLATNGSGGGYHRAIARLGVQVAEALAYAHKQGILHRDIKPSNLLLDAQGTVWVTDFGLAKAEGAEDLTHTGDIVGTVRYMAPERFDGRSLPQGDVYALGMTLYELLTLRPAFDGNDRNRLIKQVMHEPPTPPRQLDPQIARDLETIVLKCVAKDATERYASAEALAEDLRRFLADRPIKARRSTASERLWRWCRRNRVAATLSALLLVVLLATAVAGVVMSLRLNEALGQAQGDRDKARDAVQGGKRKLFESYVAGADAMRMSRRPGQRFVTIQRLRDALEVTREIGLSAKDRLRLRNIAIAALCLPDVELGLAWPVGADKPLPEQLDPVIRRTIEAHYALERLPAPASWMGEYSFSSDGRLLVVATERWSAQKPAQRVRLWRLEAKPVLVREVPDRVLGWNCIAFRADNRQVAFGHDNGTVSIWDTETGQPVRRLERPPGGVSPLVYHPRLPRLAVAGGSEVAIWDVEAGKCLVRLPHPQQVSAIAWHPRGHRLATASGKYIHLWDAATGEPVTQPWRGHLTEGIVLRFDHAGTRVVSGDWWGIQRLWDAATGQLLLTLPGQAWVQVGGDSPHFAADDRSLGPGIWGGKWHVSRVAGGQEMQRLHRITARGSERFIDFSLHPNGRLLAGNTQAGFFFFDLLKGEEVGFVAGNVVRAGFDQTGALWTGGSAGLLRWPVHSADGSPHRWCIGPPEWVADLFLNGHDGFSASADGGVVAVPLYSQGALVVHRGPPRRTLRLGPQYDVRWVFVSPDGRWVVTGSHQLDDSGVRYKVWDADTGRLVANLPIAEVGSFHGCSPDSRWLYVSGKESRRLDVASLAAAPPQPVAPAADRDLPLWENAWRSEPMRVGGTFSPDHLLAAFGDLDGSIQLVLVEKDEEVARLVSPEVGRIFPRSFSPDGALLLAAGEETGDLYVFDLRRIRQQLAELGLDWGDGQPTPPVKAKDASSVLAPPLQVELHGWASRK